VNEKFEEFKQQCLEGDGAKRLDMTAQREEAERFRNQSDYHLQAARDLLDGEASLIAIVEGYYSMLHRSNQALAHAGFKTSSHKCTLLGLRAVFQSSDLARELQKAMDERLNVDYYINPAKEDTKYTDPEKFIQQTTKPFLLETEERIKQEL
jgi:uncharacterized protein (UPF0332 family)